jgi:O-antigen/teichoic acid export membrane protein/O-antigen ligase
MVSAAFARTASGHVVADPVPDQTAVRGPAAQSNPATRSGGGLALDAGDAGAAQVRPEAEASGDHPHRRSSSVVAVLTGYLFLVEIVPSGWAVAGIGAAGTPANIYALIALVWFGASWLTGRVKLPRETRAPRLAIWIFGAAILLAYVSLSSPSRSAVSLELQAADRGLIGLVAWIGVVVIASAGIRDYGELKLLLRRAVIFGCVAAGLEIVEFTLSRDLLASVHLPGLSPSSTVSELMVRGSFVRPSSLAAQPLELAGVLSLLLPFAIQQAFEPDRTRFVRRWLPVGLIGAALPLTVSRTSIIGLAIVLLLLLPTWKPQRRWPALGVLVVGVGMLKLAVPGLISTTAGLFGSFLGDSDDSTQARTADYAGVAPYIEQRPWFGRGFDTFIPSLYRYTDNMYLLSLVEIGIVGALALLGLFLVGYRCGRVGRKLFRDESRRELGQSFAAAMAAALVLSATFDSLGFPMFAGVFFVLLGFSGAYLGIARREAGPAAMRAILPRPINAAPTGTAPINSASINTASINTAPINTVPISSVPKNAVPINAMPTFGTAMSAFSAVRHTMPQRPRTAGGPQTYPLFGTPEWRHVSALLPSEPELRTPQTPDTAALPQPPPDDADADLHGSVRKGVRWSFINTVVMRLGNFLTGVVLARGLLGPREWGLYAIGLAALSVLLAANEMGVSLAIVRWEGDVRRFAPTVLTLSTASSTLLYLLLYFVAPETARLLGSSDATGMLRVLGIAVIIDGISCVPGGMLNRTFAQRRRMAIDAGNFVVSSGLTIGLAVAGFGAMSFAWGSVAGNVVGLVGCGICAPGMLRPGWNRRQARELMRYGLPLAGASLLVLMMLNVDSVVIGATLGPVSLGLYQIAFNMSSWPVRSVSEIARRVSFAGFSRIAGTGKLAGGFGDSLALLMTAAMPASVLLLVLAKPLIHFVYGGQWTLASGALSFLAMLGVLRVAFELAYDCLVAAGRKRALILVQGWWLVALIPTLIFAARARGIAGVGAGHVLVAGPLVAPFFIWALAQAGIGPMIIVRACARPFLGGVVMGAIAFGIQQLHLPLAAGLFASAIPATLVYTAIVWPTLRQIRPKSRSAPKPAAGAVLEAAS